MHALRLGYMLPDMESSVAAAPSTAPEFGELKILCEVHIHQGHAGQVQAIDFGECIGDSVWQADSFQLHGCSDPKRCSDGCVAATTNAAWDRLNNLLHREEGANKLHVAQ